MRVCTFHMGICLGWCILNSEKGRVASYFDTEEDAVRYAVENGWEVF